jgi:uncharacterized protein YggE
MNRFAFAISSRMTAASAGLLALLAMQVPALADNTPPIRTMTLSGEGEIKAAPDEAQFSVGVVNQAKTAAAALAANSRAMNEVFATLKRLGIPDKSMQTSDLSVTPQYQTTHNGNGPQRIANYEVSNSVFVTVDDLGKFGPALDALVASGSNSVDNIAFTIRDPKQLLAQARTAAMKDAIERAQTYAHAAGLQLGPIVSISEGGSEVPSPVFRAAKGMMMAAPQATPVAAGQLSVSVTVNVTYEIR